MLTYSWVIVKKVYNHKCNIGFVVFGQALVEFVAEYVRNQRFVKSECQSPEERYVWVCPYCGGLCEDVDDDPTDEESVVCEHCGKEAKCEFTDR